ncbi:hypothetical protein E2562_023375 [Oryza meyeriana var. granulata]|uniref:glutathione transferase n=1 Tax=Oryza meyeriana var. granulata TaxID=110450 RepID=A0A6G1E0W0_9ORYZ|nr:hypothetical protein E2562_023375 [Oryza meyeriana var. granulata]
MLSFPPKSKQRRKHSPTYILSMHYQFIHVGYVLTYYAQTKKLNRSIFLSESRAIARYVLRKYKPELLGLGEDGSLEKSAMVDVWLDVEAHQHEAAVKPIVLHCIVNKYVGQDRDQGLVDESIQKLEKLFEVYEARLSGSRYLAGDRISLADLSHFSFMRYFMATEYAGVIDAYPHVKAWWEALLARPSVKKVMAGMPPDFGLGRGNRP